MAPYAEPVSGCEPLTCRLQEVCSRAARALAAPIAQTIALMAPAALALSGASFHELFHTDGGRRAMAVTERSSRTRRSGATCDRGRGASGRTGMTEHPPRRHVGFPAFGPAPVTLGPN